ncbi:ammonium transporter [Alkalihalobacillus sp. MEB130]|uniref:ammonium transporter n=1 Tax=Alkalihalobacillus sp. MEB130 TaxID=2976704 RepID=UPI0028DD5BCA|nr:ammonium transporter [Alkalihalobacillus sp. MEB130]MDT8861357.1 ammonium transporter [Alkalihalobacillus sp. MEB130]
MKGKILLLLTFFMMITTIVSAEEPVVTVTLDSMWIIIATIIVFLMHGGFAMLEIGFTRSKNALSILMKNFLTISLGTILYFVAGYAIMFGTSANGFIGTDGFFLAGNEIDMSFFVFQAVFAATCATIISGAVAERIRLSSYLIITAAMVVIIYPVVGHWTWGGGWLDQLGFIDFAGSSVLHLTGAVGAAVVAAFLGGRIGKYTNGKVNTIPAHSIPLGALGVFILWWGWFGFNGGSVLAADPELVPIVITNTLLAASAGVIGAAGYSQLKYKRVDASLTLNGALGGLVGITAGADSMSLISAVIVGAIAGVILIESVQFIDRKLKIDDPVGAVAVHGVCGIWGTVAIGIFSYEVGLINGGGFTQLGIQMVGVVAVLVWVGVAAALAVGLAKLFGPIRVPRDIEIEGLDITEHGSAAYDLGSDFGSRMGPQSTNGTDAFGLANRLNNLGKSKSDVV